MANSILPFPSQRRLRPEHADEVAAIVREANASHQSVEILGGGTKRSLGNPVSADAQLDVSAIQGIDLYEPEELIIKVRAGTPMSQIRAALAEKRQHLAFDPPSYAAFFGDSEADDTIGGIVSCNLSGSRRISTGSVRDAVLGIEGVNGLGEAFKGGGRTVKNVTGYDLPKLLTGSFGIFAIITSVTLKVQPLPEQQVTLQLTGLNDPKAIQVLADVLRLPLDISAAAHVAGRSSPPITALRLEGFAASVAARKQELDKHLRQFGDVTSIDGDESAAFWRHQRDLSDFASDSQACLWRLLLPADHAARIVATIGGEVLYEWGGSQTFVRATEEKARREASALRALVSEVGGSAGLFKAPIGLRRELGACHPPPKAYGVLLERLRSSFDPNDILNPDKLAVADSGAF